MLLKQSKVIDVEHKSFTTKHRIESKLLQLSIVREDSTRLLLWVVRHLFRNEDSYQATIRPKFLKATIRPSRAVFRPILKRRQFVPFVKKSDNSFVPLFDRLITNPLRVEIKELNRYFPKNIFEHVRIRHLNYLNVNHRFFYSTGLVIGQNFHEALAAGSIFGVFHERILVILISVKFVISEENEEHENCVVRKPHSGLKNVMPSFDRIGGLLITIGCGIVVVPRSSKECNNLKIFKKGSGSSWPSMTFATPK